MMELTRRYLDEGKIVAEGDTKSILDVISLLKAHGLARICRAKSILPPDFCDFLILSFKLKAHV
jgi:hypothetical protein